MERTKHFSPEVEAELIALSEQGDPRVLAIKKLREEVEALRLSIENNRGPAEDIVWRTLVQNHIKRTPYYRLIFGAGVSFSNRPRPVFVQIYDSPEAKQNPIPELPAPQEEAPHQGEHTEEEALEGYVPYQTTQLACASIFLICAASLTAWFTLGVQLISPLVSIIGILGSTTICAMSWSAGREIERDMGEEE